MRTHLETDPAFRAALEAAGLCRFEDFMRARGGPPASRHRHRETLPIDIPIGGERRRFFLKRVFKVPPRHALRPMLRLQPGFSQPAREWRICRQLAQAGIRVMKPVAFGERRYWGVPVQAFLLVEAVPMRHTLEDWLVPGFPKPCVLGDAPRARLLESLGTLVGRLYAAGFDWPDICAKHIFAEPGESTVSGRRWELCLIDVERMRRTRPRPSSPRDSLPRGLDDICNRLLTSLVPMRFEREDAARFRAGLFAAGGPDGPEQPPPVGAAPRHSAGPWPHRPRGPDHAPRLPDGFEHPRYRFLRKAHGVSVDERMLPWLEPAGLSNLEGIFAYTGGAGLVKPGLGGHRDRTRLELADARGDVKVFYLKRYHRLPLRPQLRRMWEYRPMRSSGEREIRCIKRLSALGIPTARAVAYGAEMRGPIERRSYCLTEEIEGESLERLVERIRTGAEAPPAPRVRRDIIRQLAWIVARLHANRLFHRDLYLCHVFLCRNADGAVVLRLIDLARMLERPGLTCRWAIKDLAALDYSSPADVVTRADRLRFLYDYASSLGTGGRGTGLRRAGRATIRRVLRRAARMRRHDAKRRPQEGGKV